MAVFQITDPQGNSYEVTGPEGSTREDAIKKLRQQQISDRPEEPWYEDLAEGVGLSGLETYYGIKDLVSETDQEDQARLEDWRQDAAQSGFGTAGQVVGEIGQLLVPGGALTKALRVAGKVDKAAKAARRGRALTRALGDTAAATGLGAVQAPDVGETRGGNAQGNAAGSILGEGIGFGLGKAIRGINKTDAAERLLEEGVSLTPGSAANSKFIEGVETVAEVTPIVAHGVKRAKEKAIKDINEVALQKSAAPGKSVTKLGTEGVKQLKDGFKESYKDAWSGAQSISNQAKKSFVDYAVNAGSSFSKKPRSVLKSVLDDFKTLSGNVNPEKFQELDNVLRKQIASSKKDFKLQETLVELRKILRSGAPSEVADKLSSIDAKYGSYLVSRRAAKNAAQDAGEFSPRGLINAVKAIGRDSAGEGAAPLQQFATDAAQTAGKEVGGQPLEWFRRIAGITPTPFPMQLGGRVALGQTRLQKAAQKSADQIPEYLLRPGAYGASMDVEEDDWVRGR